MKEQWDIRSADSFRGTPGLSNLALTLPARYYTSPEIFQAEMDRFFLGSWICAGRAERIPQPGDYFLRNFAGESLIVTRDAAGTIRAFFNVCRHRGTRMCTVPEGAFAGRIACPYHGWTYALDGSLLGAPHMEQPGFLRADYPLRAVAAEVWDGHIFLHCGVDRQPLAAPCRGGARRGRGGARSGLAARNTRRARRGGVGRNRHAGLRAGGQRGHADHSGDSSAV